MMDLDTAPDVAEWHFAKVRNLDKMSTGSCRVCLAPNTAELGCLD